MNFILSSKLHIAYINYKILLAGDYFRIVSKGAKQQR